MSIKDRAIRLLGFAGFCLCVVIVIGLTIYGFGRHLTVVAAMLFTAFIVYQMFFGDDDD